MNASLLTWRAAMPGDALAPAELHAEGWRPTYRGMMADEFLDGAVTRIAGFICAFAHHDPRCRSRLTRRW